MATTIGKLHNAALWNRLLRESDLGHVDRLVVYTIAGRAQFKTFDRCFVSVATLAEDAGLTDRPVRMAMRRLEQRGILLYDRRSKGGTNSKGKPITHLLRLDMDALARCRRAGLPGTS